MRYLQAIAASLALLMLAALVGCSSGSSSTPPPPPAISVSVSGAPATMDVNTTADLTATVSNDSANGGVTWSCAPSGSCGSFSAATTASGAPTTYTAPSAVPASAVTITAASVTDPTKTGTASITITQPAIALADGNYVFTLGGQDFPTAGPSGTVSAYFVTGAFTVSSGAITVGEQDFVDNTVVTQHDSINPTGSGFTTTADGNLQITLVTCLAQDCTQTDPAVGVGGIETFNGSLVTASRARLMEFDLFATSSGTLELQDTTAAAATPAGGYAFAVQGTAGSQAAIGGILNISGTTISTTGTVFDLNAGGVISSNQAISAGSITAPDTFGRLQISLTPANTSIGALNLVGYIVDGGHIQLVEGADQLGGTTGGTALAQTGNLTITGSSYALGMTGVHTFVPFQAAAILTADASGNVLGTISYNDLVNAQSPAVTLTGGTYVADATNLGRVTMSGVTDGNFTFNIQLYIDGNGNAMAITLDSAQDVLEGPGYLQTTGGTFTAGTYVLGATGADFSSSVELDSVGPVASDGTSAFSGFADLNWLGFTDVSPDLAVSGTFDAPIADVSSGAGDTLTGLDVVTPTAADLFDYYMVDSTRVIGIEVDSNQNTLGYFELVQ